MGRSIADISTRCRKVPEDKVTEPCVHATVFTVYTDAARVKYQKESDFLTSNSIAQI